MRYVENDGVVILENPKEVQEAFFIPERFDYDAGSAFCGGLMAGLHPNRADWKFVSLSFSNKELSDLWANYEIANAETKPHLWLDGKGGLKQDVDPFFGQTEREVGNDTYFRVLTNLLSKYKTLDNIFKHFSIGWDLNSGYPFYIITNKEDSTYFKFRLREDLTLYIGLMPQLLAAYEEYTLMKDAIDQEAIFTI